MPPAASTGSIDWVDSPAALTDARGSFLVDHVRVGPPAAGEVRVAIRASGVCHTDLKTMRHTRHIVMGHEGAGVVDRVGAGVTHVVPGDRVVLNWAMPCGRCFQCLRGAENICEHRSEVPAERILFRDAPVGTSFRLGTMSAMTVVPSAAVVRIPPELAISFESACILGCGVMTGVGSVLNVARVSAGSSVVVLGCGGVGLSVVQGARIAGAGQIVAVDRAATRLAMARGFGATHTIEVQPDDADLARAAESVRGLTDGRGADYAFECLGAAELGPAPLRMIRHGGTAVGVSGIEQPVTMNFELFEWDKTYITALYGGCRPAVDFPRLLAYFRDGLLHLDEMVTRRYALADLGQAFDDMKAGRNAKGVIVMDPA
jgi:Zn-dependent alcohol dehydrogenase